jgi:hypothetical protein
MAALPGATLSFFPARVSFPAGVSFPARASFPAGAFFPAGAAVAAEAPEPERGAGARPGMAGSAALRAGAAAAGSVTAR